MVVIELIGDVVDDVKAIKDELEWIRQGAKARQTKSKARIRKFEQLQDAQKDRKPGKAQIVIQVPERLGGPVELIRPKVLYQYADLQLEARSAFPRLVEWEERHGSLLAAPSVS